jgi:hypothetical protein
LEIFIGFSEEWHRESKKKIVEFRIGQLIYNPQFINNAIAVIDRPLQAIFWGGKKAFFQNESVLKVD